MEQSNGAPSHLCALITSESAPSTPSHIQRHSGRIIALPAIAASTCSQIPWRRAMSVIAAIGQIAVGEILGDHFCEGVRAHRIFGVEWNESQIVASEACEQRALVDRTMGV